MAEAIRGCSRLQQREGLFYNGIIMNKIYLLIFSAVVVVLVLGGAIYYYLAKESNLTVSTSSSEQEIAALILKVGELIILPEGESPTVATVTNPELLRNQPFFANAKNGDKVLIYTRARKAILYNPASNKIVEVAPINFETAGSGR